MNIRTLDSASAKRISMGVAVLTGLILAGAAIYTFFGGADSRPADGPKIIAATHAYALALKEQHLPIPHALPLQVLVDKGLLQTADIGPFQGLDAEIFLTSSDKAGPRFPLMRVHLPDGTDLVLWADGSSQKVKR
jgi:hypothetical protein